MQCLTRACVYSQVLQHQRRLHRSRCEIELWPFHIILPKWRATNVLRWYPRPSCTTTRCSAYVMRGCGPWRVFVRGINFIYGLKNGKAFIFEWIEFFLKISTFFLIKITLTLRHPTSYRWHMHARSTYARWQWWCDTCMHGPRVHGDGGDVTYVHIS